MTTLFEAVRDVMGVLDLGQVLMVIFTGVVAGSTVVYAKLTSRLVAETQRLREAQTEPRVSIRVEADHSGHLGYELVIQNIGQGVAKNVRFEFEGDPSYFRNSWVNRCPPRVNELPVIRDGLDDLEPNQVYRFPLGTVSPEEYERAVATPWTFRTKYENLYGNPRTATQTVHFSQFTGMLFEPNHLKEIAERMKTMQKDLHRLTEGHARVQVVTQTRRDFEQRREESRKAQDSHIANVTEKTITDDDEE